MNSIILDCYNVNAHTTDSPSHFVIDLTDALKHRVRALNEAVKTLNASAITDYLTKGQFCHEQVLSDAAEANNGLSKVNESALTEKNDEIFVVDCQMLVVTRGTFYFEAVPDHSGDDCVIRTQDIPVIAVVDNNPYEQLSSALEAGEYGDARSLLDEYFSNDCKYLCQFLQGILKRYQHKVTISHDKGIGWSYTELEEVQG